MVADNNLVRAGRARGAAFPFIDASPRDFLRVILPSRERRQTVAFLRPALPSRRRSDRVLIMTRPLSPVAWKFTGLILTV